ncbi:MAG: insulinase family protein [Hyphomicrobiales bacterium]|nr:insulinase family protein [Hyphomicrobiales bacterium]MDE1973455.1 insulinase family protein [Hyphomicrobiales bacterium]MDE2285211.1 insulinase family protein [Hyphomicrobiales bacterium]MDE2374422.1 insulinase family protein [Hyphomicrobiales bacterium]
MRKFLLLVALLAAVGAAGGAIAKPDVTHFTLPNGLEVVVIPDHRAPVVTHMIWYKVGAADETPGKSGLAHFLEHLMFKGTARNPADRFSLAVAAIGGQENAFTTSDYTGFFQRVPRDHLKEMMAFEADRITGLVLTDAVVRPELNVVLEEQNMRVANNPNSRLAEQMDAALYLNHPYGRPVIGWRSEIEKLDRDDALNFYRRFYTPNNAIVVVAGDVTAEEVKADAEDTYGKVEPRVDIAPRRRPREPQQEASRTVTLADARVEQPSMSRYYLAPSRTTAKPGESEALEVLAHILGSGANSRLYRSLVVEQKLALNAGAYYSGTALDYGKFDVYASPQPGKTLHDVEAAIDAVLTDVRENGVTADELALAKNRLIADAVYAQDNQVTLARWYGAALATGQTVEMVQRWPDNIRTVTADAIRAAARQWLDRRSSVTGYLVNSYQAAEKHS